MQRGQSLDLGQLEAAGCWVAQTFFGLLSVSLTGVLQMLLRPTTLQSKDSHIQCGETPVTTVSTHVLIIKRFIGCL